MRFFVLCAFLCVSCGPSGPQPERLVAVPGPELLKCIPAIAEVEVGVGRRAHASFKLQNESDQEIVITKRVTTCSCTEVTLSSEVIAAGSTIEAVLSTGASSVPLRRKGSLYLYAEGTSPAPIAKLTLIARYADNVIFYAEPDTILAKPGGIISTTLVARSREELPSTVRSDHPSDVVLLSSEFHDGWFIKMFSVAVDSGQRGKLCFHLDGDIAESTTCIDVRESPEAEWPDPVTVFLGAVTCGSVVSRKLEDTSLCLQSSDDVTVAPQMDCILLEIRVPRDPGAFNLEVAACELGLCSVRVVGLGR